MGYIYICLLEIFEDWKDHLDCEVLLDINEISSSALKKLVLCTI